MTTLLRLLLLLLMGGALLTARWADGLGQPAPAVPMVRVLLPAQPVARQAWLPYEAWGGWGRPTHHTLQPAEASEPPVRAL